METALLRQVRILQVSVTFLGSEQEFDGSRIFKPLS